MITRGKDFLAKSFAMDQHYRYDMACAGSMAKRFQGTYKSLIFKIPDKFIVVNVREKNMKDRLRVYGVKNNIMTKLPKTSELYTIYKSHIIKDTIT